MKLTKVVHKGQETFQTTYYDAETSAPIPHGEDPFARESYPVTLCSEDGAVVRFSNVGRSEYATCSGGHRWQYNFSTTAPGWVLIDG